MPRTYKSKGKRGLFTQDDLTTAIELVRAGKSVRESAKATNVDRSTLGRYLKKGLPEKCNLGCQPIFTPEEETELSSYIITCSKMFHGLSLEKTKELAYQYAKNLGKNFPQKWILNESAGRDWLEGFRKRNVNLALRTPEPTSLARATAFNKTTVGEFFDNLEKVQTENLFSPDRIYNLDETGITTVQRPTKVLTEKGTKQLGQMVSSERGVLVTLCCCVNASGQALPPAYIFPRVHFKEHMLNGSPPSSFGVASKTGWMTAELFPVILKHFIKHMNVSIERKALLLLDNHSSHISAEAIQVAKENGLVLLTFPPHCSHRMQPLDVSVFGPFKSYYSSCMNQWMMNHPGCHVTIYNLAELSGQAFLKAMVPINLIKGFSSTGICPLNRDVFTEDQFLSSFVTDRPINVASHSAENENPASDVQNSNRSPLPPLPKAAPRKTATKRKRSVSTILTKTPENSQSSSSSDSESIHLSDSEEISDLDEPVSLEIEIGKFVVVEFAQKKSKIHFVGEIVKLTNEDVMVDFLRCQNKKFIKPEIKDCYYVDRDQVVAVLPMPVTQGRTERTLSGITFAVNLDEFNIR